jgi:hypothetical protein
MEAIIPNAKGSFQFSSFLWCQAILVPVHVEECNLICTLRIFISGGSTRLTFPCLWTNQDAVAEANQEIMIEPAALLQHMLPAAAKAAVSSWLT